MAILVWDDDPLASSADAIPALVSTGANVEETPKLTTESGNVEGPSSMGPKVGLEITTGEEVAIGIAP